MSCAGVQMFMDKLNYLINCNDIPFINIWTIKRKRPQFQLLYQELGFMIQTLYIHQHQDLEKVNDLKKRFTDAAEEAQYIVDLFLSSVLNKNNGDFTTPDDGRRSFKSVFNLFLSCVHIRKNEQLPTSDDSNPSLNLDGVWRSFESVKVELTAMKIDSSPRRDKTLNQSAAHVSFTINPQGSKKLMDEFVVGLDCDFGMITDKLVEDQKKLDIVSIVGMGGIGKTTLATKVFNDPFIMYHFHVRVWVTVAQIYNKRDVLIQILESIRCQLHLEKDTSDSRLRELVHKNLMGKRYLIVIDDIWHTETWDDLKVFFPHDNNGSRILLTTRLTEVAKRASSHGLIHHIGYLNKERSWELLCKKVFHGHECPQWSTKPGMQIVESCKGLPLAVAVIAGVLAYESLSEKFWVEIAYRTRSYIVCEQNGCLEILGLSYNHLPIHLRECFLYLGGFPEDYRFEVRRLISLWVAEGFIQEDGNRSLEDIAQGYLMDLIGRNLVIVANRSKSSGVVKACKVHDLVRELCLKKAKEKRFFIQFPDDITTPPYNPVRMFINKDINIEDFHYPSVKNLRAFLHFSFIRSYSDDIARCFRSFVLLRVLDLHNCELNIDFSKGMELLVHLRYLAIWNSLEDFPSSICNLWNLQTLIYRKEHSSIVLPSNISDLVNLRHLWSYRGATFVFPSIGRPMNLQTISNVMLGDGVHKIQMRFPYIKKFTCATSEITFKTFQTFSNVMMEYDFKSLTYLENLKITGFGKNHFTFPTTLKTLTLEWCGLAWSDMSIIQSLPNLQVLKLRTNTFQGSCWNTEEQEFRELKFLRLQNLDIKQWVAYSTSFPCLRQLEIFHCEDLEEIPLEIGDIPMLHLIKIKECRHSVGESVRRIQEEQHDFGKYDLNIDISANLSDE